MNWSQCVEWAKSFKLSLIKSVEIVKMMSIRQLKALAAKMNKELGLVICKALFGKSYSNMVKKELTDAIWFVRSLQLACPKGSNWNLVELAKSVFAYELEGQAWVHYVGFNDEASALIFHRDTLLKRECKLASVRQADRLSSYGYKWEVKLWGWNRKAEAKAEATTLLTEKVYIVDDEWGWDGNSGTIVKEEGNHVWLSMTGQEDKPKMRFKKEQVKKEEELTLPILQSMLDNNLGRRTEDVIRQFIINRGYAIDGNVVKEMEF